MGLFSDQNDAAIAAMAARLARLEGKLDAMLAHFQIEMPPDDGLNGVRDLVAAGNKIGAIKEYRARTGAGLAEAKQAVERGL